MGAIYLIHFGNREHCYIGSAISFSNRKAVHLYNLRKNKNHSRILQNAFNKHGEANMRFEILADDIPSEDLLAWEQAFLDYYNPSYNIAKFAESRYGVKNTEESNRKNSESNSGSKSVHCGRIRTVEERQYMSTRSKNIKKTYCKSGHEFTEENIYRFKRANGNIRRSCRQCNVLRKQRYRQRRKSEGKHVK